VSAARSCGCCSRNSGLLCRAVRSVAQHSASHQACAVGVDLLRPPRGRRSRPPRPGRDGHTGHQQPLEAGEKMGDLLQLNSRQQGHKRLGHIGHRAHSRIALFKVPARHRARGIQAALVRCRHRHALCRLTAAGACVRRTWRARRWGSARTAARECSSCEPWRRAAMLLQHARMLGPTAPAACPQLPCWHWHMPVPGRHTLIGIMAPSAGPRISSPLRRTYSSLISKASGRSRLDQVLMLAAMLQQLLTQLMDRS
jgi:hypothetical protein